MVATGYFFACAKVLPEAIFREELRQSDFYESAISPYRYCLYRVQQVASINDIQECYLLLPDFDHSVIKGGHELLAFALRIRMLIDYFVHSSALNCKSV